MPGLHSDGYNGTTAVPKEGHEIYEHQRVQGMYGCDRQLLSPA